VQAAKDVVLAQKPVITDDAAVLEPALLSQLMAQLSTLASVYHKPADTFISRQRLAVQKASDMSHPSFEEEEGPAGPSSAPAVVSCHMHILFATP
jgi:AP-1 complex subunit beta-1